MVTLTNLRTRLRKLDGRSGTLNDPLSDHYDECINVAISQQSVEGERGVVKRWLTGETWGDFTPSNDVSQTKGSATLTLTGETLLSENIYPGDVIDLDGTRYTITAVLSDTTLDVGAPMRANATTTAADVTIHRRTLEMPKTGTVFRVKRLDGKIAKDLDEDPDAIATNCHETGQAEWYEVAYSQGKDNMHIRFGPIETAAARFEIGYGDIPARLTTGSDDLDWPDASINSMLLKALEISRMGLRAAQDQQIMAGTERRRMSHGHLSAVSGPGRARG